MKKAFQIVSAAILAATATLAVARTPAQSFADRFSVLQSYSGFGPMYHPAPTFSSKPDDPTTGLSESRMQALSNGDPTWHPRAVARAAAAASGPLFAQTRPEGLPYDYYQAAASHSNEFKLPPYSGAPAYATAIG